MHLEPTEAWHLLHICAALIAIFLLAVHLIKLAVHLIKLKKNVPLFYFWLGAIAVLGGAAAFFLPIAVNSGFAKDDDGSALRQAILYTTGGLLGVITLGETHRKNNQEKEKNENDHTRQVYAERRSRYTTAVEQLANEKAAVRLGGIYTLVGLVDEWLADKTLKPEATQKEGQIIINNLCSYIREPFTEADYLIEKTNIATYFEDNYLTPQHYDETDSIDSDPLDSIRLMYSDLKIPAPIKEESEVRKSIIQEITNRLKKHTGKINIQNTFDNKWSAFNYDFSNAHFFYAFDIRNTIWRGTLDLSGAYFTNDVYLTNCTVTTGATLEGTKFGGINIECETEFSKISPTWNVILFNTKFTKGSNFTDVNFTNKSLFAKLTFTTPSYFTKAIFNCPADFMDTTFKPGTCFDDAIFKDEASFNNKKIQCGISFKNAKLNSNFYHNFSGIDKIGIVKLAGDNQEVTECEIPVGARLFDPDSWDEEAQKYTRVSDPAEPLDNSDSGEEDKSK